MNLLRGFLMPGEREPLLELARKFVVGSATLALRDVSLEACPAAQTWLGKRKLAGAYLAYYPVGASRPPHVDRLERGRAHERLVVLLERAAKGGELVVRGEPVDMAEGDGFTFRADLELHEVREVVRGARLALTVGAAT